VSRRCVIALSSDSRNRCHADQVPYDAIMSTNTIARLKITLDDVKPTVLRRIEVPAEITLDRLHLTIQAAMGWHNSHLYELRLGDVSWSTPYPEIDSEGDFLDARKVRLRDVLADLGKNKLAYLYDFGDGWEHSIRFEGFAEPEAGLLYPRLIEVSRPCPPEDCGGPWGYADLLKAIRDPSDERHAELLEWVGEEYDPDADNAETLIARVASLARTWSRKPAARRAKPR
jgi:Plasmid pRiA4b ORF-3-like protein